MSIAIGAILELGGVIIGAVSEAVTRYCRNNGWSEEEINALLQWLSERAASAPLTAEAENQAETSELLSRLGKEG